MTGQRRKRSARGAVGGLSWPSRLGDFTKRELGLNRHRKPPSSKSSGFSSGLQAGPVGRPKSQARCSPPLTKAWPL